MRIRRPRKGDLRIKETFLFLPMTLYTADGELEERWLEKGRIVQKWGHGLVPENGEWYCLRWADDGETEEDFQ